MRCWTHETIRARVDRAMPSLIANDFVETLSNAKNDHFCNQFREKENALVSVLDATRKYVLGAELTTSARRLAAILRVEKIEP